MKKNINKKRINGLERVNPGGVREEIPLSPNMLAHLLACDPMWLILGGASWRPSSELLDLDWMVICEVIR